MLGGWSSILKTRFITEFFFKVLVPNMWHKEYIFMEKISLASFKCQSLIHATQFGVCQTSQSSQILWLFVATTPWRSTPPYQYTHLWLVHTQILGVLLHMHFFIYFSFSSFILTHEKSAFQDRTMSIPVCCWCIYMCSRVFHTENAASCSKLYFYWRHKNWRTGTYCTGVNECQWNTWKKCACVFNGD